MLELCYFCKMSVFERVNINCKQSYWSPTGLTLRWKRVAGGERCSSELQSTAKLREGDSYRCRGICLVQEVNPTHQRGCFFLVPAVRALESCRDKIWLHSPLALVKYSLSHQCSECKKHQHAPIRFSSFSPMTTAWIGVRENGKFIKNIPLMVVLVVYITYWEKLTFRV